MLSVDVLARTRTWHLSCRDPDQSMEIVGWMLYAQRVLPAPFFYQAGSLLPTGVRGSAKILSGFEVDRGGGGDTYFPPIRSQLYTSEKPGVFPSRVIVLYSIHFFVDVFFCLSNENDEGCC